MKITSEKKGISLIVLVITIIILALLAIVSISTISSFGIIDTAFETMEQKTMSELKEKAELVKMDAYILVSTGKSGSAKLNRDRLLHLLKENFEGSTKYSNKITTKDKKYDIIVSANLEITVSKNVENQLKRGELLLLYDVEEVDNGNNSIIKVTPIIGQEKGTYEEYATKILAKTSKSYEQIFIKGTLEQLYNNLDWTYYNELKNITDFSEFIEIYLGYENISSVAALVEKENSLGSSYNDEKDLLIQWELVEYYVYSPSYVSYAADILQTTSKSLEEIYMEGAIYWYDDDFKDELRSAKDFEEYIYIENGYTDVTTIEEYYQVLIEEGCEFENIEEFLISWEVVDPEGYYDYLENFYYGGSIITITCSDGTEKTTISGEPVSFTVTNSGMYVIIGLVEDTGETKKVSVMLGVTDSSDSLNWDEIFENATLPHPDQDIENVIALDYKGDLVDMDNWNWHQLDDGTYNLAEWWGSYYTEGYMGGIDENGKILSEIPAYIKTDEDSTFMPVTGLNSTFMFNKDIKSITKIPSSVTDMNSTFWDCESLIEAPEIPNSVTNMKYTFSGCRSLEVAPVIPASVTNVNCTFSECTSLIEAPEIPLSISDLECTFRNCTALTKAPVIPNSVTSMFGTFDGCSSLTEAPVIPTSVTNMCSTFSSCTSLIEAPVIPNSVTDMSDTFFGCTSLEVAPVIPASVTNISETFNGCTGLTGTIRINSENVTSFKFCFSNITETLTVQVPAGSTTYDKLTAEYGTSGNIIIETF